jgi:parvulin-like peptidyl-prolyl isomerase
MIIARVNDYEIEEKEYLAELRKLLREVDLQTPDPALGNKALDNLINGALILQEARNHNVQVTEDEVQQEMIQLQLKFKTPEEFENMLSCSGCTEEQIFQLMKDKLMVRRYLESCIPNDFKVDDEYLKDFYQKHIELFYTEEMVRVYHILIPFEKGIAAARELRAGISKPADFYRAAEGCSECPSCCQAGDLGFIIKGKMVEDFDEVAFSLPKNEISQPIETKHGYHIIMVTDHKDAGTLSFEEVKEPVKKRLYQIEYDLKIERHIIDLREKGDIYVNEEYFMSNN